MLTSRGFHGDAFFFPGCFFSRPLYIFMELPTEKIIVSIFMAKLINE